MKNARSTENTKAQDASGLGYTICIHTKRLTVSDVVVSWILATKSYHEEKAIEDTLIYNMLNVSGVCVCRGVGGN